MNNILDRISWQELCEISASVDEEVLALHKDKGETNNEEPNK